jgi:hypothetical protein
MRERLSIWLLLAVVVVELELAAAAAAAVLDLGQLLFPQVNILLLSELADPADLVVKLAQAGRKVALVLP